jgi:hypothetical protein
MMARRKNVSKKEKNTYKIGKAMMITISGAVGIGTQTPCMRLEIGGKNKVQLIESEIGTSD